MLRTAHVPGQNQIAMERIIISLHFTVTLMLSFSFGDELFLSVVGDSAWDLKILER